MDKKEYDGELYRLQRLMESIEGVQAKYPAGDIPAQELGLLETMVKEAEAISARLRTGEAQRRQQGVKDYLTEPRGRPIQPGGGGRGGDYGGKSIGDLFVASAAYKNRKDGDVAELDINLKTLFQTGAGWAPQSIRTGLVVEDEQRPVQLVDVIPMVDTNQAAVVYMEETTFTSAAAETAEAGTYAESALALTERTSTVRKIATWLPVTDEQMDDVGQARDYVSSRLVFMARQRLDSQIINGDGIAPNLRGILNVSGIQTQAKGADPVPDAIRKACDLVRLNGRAEPSAVVMHTNDAQDLALLRTTDGQYIFGHPSGPGPNRIWGLPIVISDALTAGTALVGDFRNFSLLAVRKGVEIDVTNAHDDYFIKGKLAVRCQMRVAFVTLRPSAFATVTGI